MSNPEPSAPHPAPTLGTLPKPPSLLLVVMLTALAGGMGWGIRGQYGHETGAMIAGVLVASVLAFFFCPGAGSLFTARAVALMTIAIGFGGSMTYGQTVGLTHDRELIGNTEALRWGLVGLFIKGGIWIALAAAFFGIGLSRVRYKPTEIGSLLILMLFFLFGGIALINQPFDPANKILPDVYFSDHWYFEPDLGIEQPRRERWGGLFMALLSVLLYVSIIKRDKLAQWLTLFGFLAGGFGFALGQYLQLYHAWHPEFFETGFFADGPLRTIVSRFNWWNMMETAFGTIFGAILALGVWINRDLIKNEPEEESAEFSAGNEWLLILVHVGALLAWNFQDNPKFDEFADHAVTMGMLPIIGIVAGRFWPYMVTLPIVILPIAGKTVRHLVYETQQIELLLTQFTAPIRALPNVGPQWGDAITSFILSSPRTLELFGWLVYGIIPVTIALVLAFVLKRSGDRGRSGRHFARWNLLFTAWVFFCLNFAFFHFPWPWHSLEEWTGRTPNAAIFTLALASITLTTLFYGHRYEHHKTSATD